MKKELDSLALKTLDALKKADNPTTWIEDKKRELIGMTRWEVLRSFSSLDRQNREAVATEIGVTFDDFEAMLRVLKKV